MAPLDAWAFAGIPWAFYNIRRGLRLRLGPRWQYVNAALGIGAAAGAVGAVNHFIPNALSLDEDVRKELKKHMRWTVAFAIAAGFHGYQVKGAMPAWGPAHYHRIMNRVFFLRPFLFTMTVFGTYSYVRALAQQRRQEVNEPGHYRPIPGQVGALAASTTLACLWMEGMPHLMMGYAALGLASWFYDYIYAYGTIAWYAVEHNPDMYPHQGHWLMRSRGSMAHNRTYDPNLIYTEPEFLPNLDAPWSNRTNYMPIEEARIRNPLAGMRTELKNTTLITAKI